MTATAEGTLAECDECGWALVADAPADARQRAILHRCPTGYEPESVCECGHRRAEHAHPTDGPAAPDDEDGWTCHAADEWSSDAGQPRECPCDGYTWDGLPDAAS